MITEYLHILCIEVRKPRGSFYFQMLHLLYTPQGIPPIAETLTKYTSCNERKIY